MSIVKHNEERITDLKKIAELANDIWMGWATSRLEEALEIKRIAEELIDKEEQDGALEK